MSTPLPPPYVELATAVREPNPSEATLLNVLQEASALPDDQWNKLSASAQAWFNDAAEKVNNQIEPKRILWPVILPEVPPPAFELTPEPPVAAPTKKKKPPSAKKVEDSKHPLLGVPPTVSLPPAPGTEASGTGDAARSPVSGGAGTAVPANAGAGTGPLVDPETPEPVVESEPLDLPPLEYRRGKNGKQGKVWTIRKVCLENINLLPGEILQKYCEQYPGMPTPALVTVSTILYDLRAVLRLLKELGVLS